MAAVGAEAAAEAPPPRPRGPPAAPLSPVTPCRCPPTRPIGRWAALLFLLLALFLLPPLLPDSVPELVDPLGHKVQRGEEGKSPLGVPGGARAVARVKVGLQLEVLHSLLNERDQGPGRYIIHVDGGADHLALSAKGERGMSKPYVKAPARQAAAAGKPLPMQRDDEEAWRGKVLPLHRVFSRVGAKAWVPGEGGGGGEGEGGRGRGGG